MWCCNIIFYICNVRKENVFNGTYPYKGHEKEK